MLVGGDAHELGHHLGLRVQTRAADMRHAPVAREVAQDVRSGVLRFVVHHDRVIDAGREMPAERLADDVGLVASLHDEHDAR
jgi:hypothetical protein